MNTFITLYHKVCNLEDNIKYDKIVDKMINEYHIVTQNLDIQTNNRFIQYTSCHLMNTFKSDFSLKNKFHFFKNYGMNIFTLTQDKNDFILFFSKIQNLYYKLNKLVFNYKLKRANKTNDKDLCFNPIIEFSNVFTLYAENTIYSFTVLDLKNIIQNSLSNTDMMFSMPLTIKNPYDNQPIAIHNLYNIYNFFKYNFINIPLIFQLYYLSNFNINRFQIENEVYIRNYLITNFLNINSKQYVIRIIESMLGTFNNRTKNKKKQIILDDEFPKAYIYNTFKDYAHIYYKNRYTLDISCKEYRSFTWETLLNEFREQNPIYGRMYIKFVNNKKTVSFNNKNNISNIKRKWDINNNYCHLDHTFNTEEDEIEEDEIEDIEEDIEEDLTSIMSQEDDEEAIEEEIVLEEVLELLEEIVPLHNIGRRHIIHFSDTESDSDSDSIIRSLSQNNLDMINDCISDDDIFDSD